MNDQPLGRPNDRGDKESQVIYNQDVLVQFSPQHRWFSIELKKPCQEMQEGNANQTSDQTESITRSQTPILPNKHDWVL